MLKSWQGHQIQMIMCLLQFNQQWAQQHNSLAQPLMHAGHFMWNNWWWRLILRSGEIGGNCQNLGITLGGQSPSPPPAGASANSTSTSPNAGMPSSSPKTLGIPVSSPGILPVSGPGAPSPSFSPGRVPVVLRTPLSDFYLTSGVASCKNALP